MGSMMNGNTDADVDMGMLDRILAARARITATDLSPLLQEIQARYGYLPPPVLLEMSRRTGSHSPESQKSASTASNEDWSWRTASASTRRKSTMLLNAAPT
jgi:hypothetical protein